MRTSVWLALVSSLASLGCGAPEPASSTGGVDVTPGPCGRGLAVVHTKYESTNVSLVNWGGEVLSSSFISSATGGAKLSAKLSGDVVLPTADVNGNELVLLDRYPASVLTWVDVKSAKVESQLSVRSGFQANPHDYLELGPSRAYVTRFEKNPDPAASSLDKGDDVLVVDPTVPRVTGSIDLSAAMADAGAGFRAAPHRLARAGARVYASLLGESTAWAPAPSRLVELDPKSDALGQVLVFDGLYECNGLAVSPDQSKLVLSCSGRFSGSESELGESGLVVVGLYPELHEVGRFPADGAPFGFSVAWSDGSHLLANTFGNEATGMPDHLVELDLTTGERRVLLSSDGEPFTLSDVRCGSACGVCFATDAGRGVLQRFDIDASGRAGAPRAVTVEDGIGLPPRFLGQF